MCVLLMLAQVLVVLHAKPGFFWTLLINSCMAYAVNLTNFLVTKYTSALTLQVLGNMKGVIAAGISIAMFKNPVTAKGMFGYAITVCGVVAYSEVSTWLRVCCGQHTSCEAGGLQMLVQCLLYCSCIMMRSAGCFLTPAVSAMQL